MDCKRQYLCLLIMTSFYGSMFHQSTGYDSVDDTPVTFELYSRDYKHLVVNWSMKSACKNDMYEIQVSRTERFNIVMTENISVSGHVKSNNSVEPFHIWSWTSELPLQCTDPSVRIRHLCNATTVGIWSQWKTLAGIRELGNWVRPQIFPSEEILLEGAEVYICCVAPPGSQVARIHFNWTQYPLINISGQVKAIAVPRVNLTSALGVVAECLDSKGGHGHTSNFVSSPPQRPRGLSCRTRDLYFWNCTWDLERPADNHKYTLLVRNSSHGPIKCNMTSCCFPAPLHLREYHITVSGTSSLGQESQSITFDALDRVFPFVKDLSVHADMTEAGLVWNVEGNFDKIPVVCQISLNNEVEIKEPEMTNGSILHFACRLRNLKPSTQYLLKVCCSIAGKSWGEWSDPYFFTTKPKVVIDAWRIIKHRPYGRLVTLIWKTWSSGTLSDVKLYKVQKQEDKPTELPPGVHHLNVEMDQRGYNLSVYAILKHGDSVSSHLTIPVGQSSEKSLRPQRSAKRVVGSVHSGIPLSWAEDTTAKCGYTIEWCANGTGAQPCDAEDLRWKKVPKNDTSTLLQAGGFTVGRRYLINVFGCREDGDWLIETQVGYLEEERPKAFPEIQCAPMMTSVAIRWSFLEDDPSHPGFITGYRLTVKGGPLSTQDLNSHGVTVSDPHSKSTVIGGLTAGTQYSLCLQACTSVGAGPPTWCHLTTRQDSASFWGKILTTGALILGCCILLWPLWNRLKKLAVDILAHPTRVNMETVDLDSSLYEVSERIRAVRVEDCACCDLEVLAAQPGVSDWRFRICSEGSSCPFIGAADTYCDELVDNIWDDSASDERGVTNVYNFTYSPTSTDVSFCSSLLSFDGIPEGRRAQFPDTRPKGYMTPATVPM